MDQFGGQVTIEGLTHCGDKMTERMQDCPAGQELSFCVTQTKELVESTLVQGGSWSPGAIRTHPPAGKAARAVTLLAWA